MRTYAFLLSLVVALTSSSQSQVRIDPVGGGLSALPPASFHVVSPDHYLVFGYDSPNNFATGISFSGTSVMWSKYYEKGLQVNGSTLLPTGESIIVGPNRNPNGLTDAFITKLDVSGNAIWSRSYDSGQEEFFTDVDQAPDGSIYAVGNVRVFGYLQTILCRFTNAGTLMWSKQEPLSFGSNIPTYICARGDSVIVFEQTGLGMKDFLIRVLDSSGNETRTKKLGDIFMQENTPNVAEKADGGFVLYSAYTPAGMKNGVIVLDADLNVSYSESVIVSVLPGNTLAAFAVQADAAGDVYLGGAVTTGGTNYSTVTKLSNGSVLWTKTLVSRNTVVSDMQFESGKLVAPSYGLSADGSHLGVVLSFLNTATGALVGAACETDLPQFALTSTSYTTLVEEEITVLPWETIVYVESVDAIVSSFPILQENCGNLTLPIELTDFTAKPNGAVVGLAWVTATETNNHYFTIERSRDGEEFEEVIEVAGAGTSLNELHYQSTDANPIEGLSYYRLRQTDFDGHSTLSNLVAVEFTKPSQFVPWPNPIAPGHLLQGIGNNSFEIVDLGGRVVLQGVGDSDIGNLATGSYVIRLEDGRSSRLDVQQ